MSNFSFVGPTGGADRLGIQKGDQLRCPDCNKSWLRVSKKHPGALICFECGLMIQEKQLHKETRYVPDKGFGSMSKPFFNQQAANTLIPEYSEKSAFALDVITDEQKLAQYSLKGLTQRGDINIESSKKVDDKTVDTIKKMTKGLGQNMKVHIE